MTVNDSAEPLTVGRVSFAPTNGAAVKRTWDPAELAMSDPEPGKMYPFVEFGGGAKVSSLRPAYHLLEKAFLKALAKVAQEGAGKYGVGNWQKGDERFAVERINHAFDHILSWINGDRSEPHLAKAAWGLMVTMWFDERHPEWFQFERPGDLNQSETLT